VDPRNEKLKIPFKTMLLVILTNILTHYLRLKVKLNEINS